MVSHGSSGTWLQHPRTFQFDLVGLDMALIDFFQVVELYKLRCADGCFIPIDPGPPPMSTPPRPSTSLFGSHRIRIGTPKRITSIARSQPGPTPPNQGSSSRKGQEGDTDRDEKFAREDYDDYIREDLHSRVFVDLEVFLKSVLHAPNDWKTQWNPAIEKVKANKNFKAHHKEYCQRCEEVGALEAMFYDPLMDTANAVLDVVSRPEFKDIISESGNPQYYQANSTKTLRGGVMSKKNLSPDLVVLPEGPEPAPGKNLHWANALHVLEVKHSDAAICDGMNMPRLIVDGKASKIIPRFIVTNIEDRSRSDFEPCPPSQPGTIPAKRVHSPHRPRTYPSSVNKATLCGTPFRESASVEKTQDRIRVDWCQ